MSKERKLYHELAAVGVAKYPLGDLNSVLWEIASGTSSFGHSEEWDEWLRYMLPDLIARSHEQYAFDFLIEHTITAFMAVYWIGIPEEYPGFTTDVLLTLGRAIMSPELWAPDPQESENPMRSQPLFLQQEDRGEEVLVGWGSSNAPGSLAASLMFCLKYLPQPDLSRWAGTLFDIEHPRWRFALLVWYVGTQALATRPIPTLRDLEEAAPGIGWENSHLLKAVHNLDPKEAAGLGHNHNQYFLDAARVREVLDVMRAQLTVDRLAAWETSFWMDPLLASQPALPAILDRALSTLAA